MNAPRIRNLDRSTSRRLEPSLLSSLTTFAVIAGSSLFFCSKGVFVKTAYTHGATPLSLLALRMLVAAPFFAIAIWVTEKRATRRIQRHDMLKLAGLGFLGYYLSSVVNFHGLQFISVGLERMVLYTYPTLVVIGSVIWFGGKLHAKILSAIALTYAGIALGWLGEAHLSASPAETLTGVALVFTSAVTYSAFVLLSGRIVREIGGIRFTAYVVLVSCVCVIAHFCLTEPPAHLLQFDREVYVNGLILGVLGTAVPSFLLGIGLARTSAQQFAIISCIGPVGTIALAWIFLDETMDWRGIVGFSLTITGGLLVSLIK